MTEVDVCLVAGRRPDLLQRTLQSFHDGMLRHFRIARSLINIDPVFGDEADLAECVRVIREYLPQPEIRTPHVPGFCTAVRENWSRTSAPYVIHLEDDWTLNAVIAPSSLGSFSDAAVAQLAFSTREKGIGFGEGVISNRDRRAFRVFGKALFYSEIPIFTTSPSILRGSFARAAAQCLDVRLDPEKQFYNRLNRKLERLAFRYRSLVLRLPDSYVLTDIGREWRNQRGIEKSVTKGVSAWTEPALSPPAAGTTAGPGD